MSYQTQLRQICWDMLCQCKDMLLSNTDGSSNKFISILLKSMCIGECWKPLLPSLIKLTSCVIYTWWKSSAWGLGDLAKMWGSQIFWRKIVNVGEATALNQRMSPPQGLFKLNPKQLVLFSPHAIVNWGKCQGKPSMNHRLSTINCRFDTSEPSRSSAWQPFLNTTRRPWGGSVQIV